MPTAKKVEMTYPSTEPVPQIIGRCISGLKRNAVLTFVLLAAGVLSRLPFRSEYLYHWDSVNFALAIEQFDLSVGQPHPPGYLLYIALARLVNILAANPPDALLLVSFLASGLSVAALLWLGSRMFSQTTGLFAALLLLASPLFWFYGEVALPHALDTFMVVLSVGLLYRVYSGSRAHFFPAVFVVALSGGFRPQTLVFLAPLAVFAALRVGWADRVRGILLSVAVCSAWLVPLIWSAGGLERYLQVTSAFSASFRYFEATTLLAQGNVGGLLYNLDKLGRYTAYAWGLAILPAVLCVCSLRWRIRTEMGSRPGVFLLVWIAPPLLFYTFVHMGQQGLVFVFLPALLLLSVEATRYLAAQVRLGKYSVAAVMLLIVGVNSMTFLWAPRYLLSGDQFKVLSRATINANDAHYAALIQTIQEGFPAEATILVGSDWRHVGYYLPQYRLIKLPLPSSYEPGDAGETIREYEVAVGGFDNGAQNIKVVFFDRGVRQVTTNAGPAEPILLASGERVWFLSVNSTDSLRWTAGSTTGSALP